MAKFLILSVVTLLFYAMTCSATLYTVGDNSGWDISTDVDTWARDKTFAIGDTLLFQYSQYHSVSELTKENYDVCNTTNALQSSNNGNTSFALSSPGDRYFACGNRLHCLGGMKLHVNVEQNQNLSPVAAPQAESGTPLPPGSARSNNPSPSSSVLNQVSVEGVIAAVFGSLVLLFGV